MSAVRPVKLVVGITGATGVIYGIRALEALKELSVETHLVITEMGKATISMETDYSIGDVEKLASKVYPVRDLAAAISSGSFPTDGMIVAPCSVRTLSAVANCANDNLLTRAADVTLKERRRLVLMFRETPLACRALSVDARRFADRRDPDAAGAGVLHSPETIDEHGGSNGRKGSRSLGSGNAGPEAVGNLIALLRLQVPQPRPWIPRIAATASLLHRRGSGRA